MNWNGKPWADPLADVSPSDFSSVEPRTFFIERVSDTEFHLTARQGEEFAGSDREPLPDAVHPSALFEAPKLVHPHHRRVAVDGLRVASEPGARRPAGGAERFNAFLDSFDPENPFRLPDLGREDAARLHEHIEQLASEHGLEWREEDIGWLEAEGAISEGWFESPMLRNEFAYLVALHEIGHHVLGLPSDDGKGQVVFANEVDVWEWALNAALIEPSEGARAQIRVCLITYPEQAPPAEEVVRLRALAPEGGDKQMRWRSGGEAG